MTYASAKRTRKYSQSLHETTQEVVENELLDQVSIRTAEVEGRLENTLSKFI